MSYYKNDVNYFYIQAFRKTASGNSGPSKAYYLYYIELNNVLFHTNLYFHSNFLFYMYSYSFILFAGCKYDIRNYL